jgi:hypothetical protein
MDLVSSEALPSMKHGWREPAGPQEVRGLAGKVGGRASRQWEAGNFFTVFQK